MFTGPDLMSILMAHLQKHFMQENNRRINNLSSDQYFKESSVPTCNLTAITKITLRYSVTMCLIFCVLSPLYESIV